MHLYDVEINNSETNYQLFTADHIIEQLEYLKTQKIINNIINNSTEYIEKIYENIWTTK